MYVCVCVCVCVPMYMYVCVSMRDYVRVKWDPFVRGLVIWVTAARVIETFSTH